MEEHGNQKGSQGTVLVERDRASMATIDVPKDEPVDLDEPALVGVSGDFRDQRFRLGPGKTTIGRRPDSDIVLPDDSVSSLHAWIIKDKSGYRVMNILSTNGTFVNDRKITEEVVEQGDRIRFGGVELVLHTGLDAGGGTAAAPRAGRGGWPGW